jgi:RimJ/RimL family protein N-acetyltransferase
MIREAPKGFHQDRETDHPASLSFYLISLCQRPILAQCRTTVTMIIYRAVRAGRRKIMFARTERLLLRPSWPEDAKALLAAVAKEDIVRNLALVPWPYTADDARAFAEAQHPLHYPQFLLWQRTDAAPQLVGACGLAQREGAAELGYWIARPYWGMGYASEAAYAVLGIARALGHRRLVSGHFTDNPASGKVLCKIGFRHTGKVELRESKGRGQVVPCALYDIELDSNGSPDSQSPVMRPRHISTSLAA